MTLIERMEGDHGPDAIIDAVAVVDVNGDPVVDGTLLLVIGQFMSGPYGAPGTALLTAEMTHEGDGTWRWEPQPGDLQVGRWRMQLLHSDVAIPSDRYGMLLVRPRLPMPPVVGQMAAAEEPEVM
jgi:hypothetical protein